MIMFRAAFLLQCTQVACAQGEVSVLLQVALPGDTSSQRKIFFERDDHGINNVRVQFETLVALAKISDRVLVLPEPSTIDHLSNPFTESQIFDMDLLREHISVEVNATASVDVYTTPDRIGSCFRDLPDSKDWYILREHSRYQHFECVEAFTEEEKSEADRVVFDGLRFKSEFRELSKHKLESLGLKPAEFIGLHARRGDFSYWKGGIIDEMTPEIIKDAIDSVPMLEESATGLTLLRSLRSFVDFNIKGLPLLISHNAEPDDTWLEEIQHMFSDRNVLFTSSCWNDDDEDQVGRAAADMLMLSEAKYFFGTPSSTFSNGIMQMRTVLHGGDDRYNITPATYREPCGMDLSKGNCGFAHGIAKITTFDALLDIP